MTIDRVTVIEPGAVATELTDRITTTRSTPASTSSTLGRTSG
jgi:NADP-dependent 3-hydroxy acid dehydrogenase YdfG